MKHERTKKLTIDFGLAQAAGNIMPGVDLQARHQFSHLASHAGSDRVGTRKRRNWPRHGAVVGRKETACRGSFCCRPARDSIVLRSDLVEVIQHLAARPQYCNAQREDYKGGHFSIPPIVESYGSNALGGRQSEQRRPVRTAHEHVLLDCGDRIATEQLECHTVLASSIQFLL